MYIDCMYEYRTCMDWIFEYVNPGDHTWLQSVDVKVEVPAGVPEDSHEAAQDQVHEVSGPNLMKHVGNPVTQYG